MRTRAPLVLLAVVLVVPTARPALSGGDERGLEVAPRPAVGPRLEEAALPLALRQRLSRSTDPWPLARLLGLRTLDGRPLDVEAPVHDRGSERSADSRNPGQAEARAPEGDVPIAADPFHVGSRPSVAADPDRGRFVVAAYLANPYPDAPEVRCAIARSTNRGQTFSPPIFLPLLTPSSYCGDPVLAWAADGRTLFAAYRDFRTGSELLPVGPGETLRFRLFGDVDVLVSRSADGGQTWSPPAVALDADPFAYTVSCKGVDPCDVEDVDPGSSYERAAIATPLQGADNVLYLTATRNSELDPALPPTAIVFTRSEAGNGFSPPRTLDVGAEQPLPVTVQGASVAGGRGNDVLVAWYHSGDDGPLAGSFEIRARGSKNAGRSWQPVVTAARDAYEAGPFLGPLGFYKQWWPMMFPDVALDAHGRAHLVYGHDPEEGDLTAEAGDVRYVTSRRAPWKEWSDPITLNDDGPGRAQGFASVTARAAARASIVDVVREDTRTSPEVSIDPLTLASPNLYYDIFHVRGVITDAGSSWSANQRVSHESSIQERSATGLRTDLTAAPGMLFAAWTDRRGVDAVTDREQDVYGAAIQGPASDQ